MPDSCNFQTFIRLLHGKINSEMNPFDPNRKAKQEDLIYALFYSYYEEHDTVCSQSKGSQYFKGQLGIPNAIKHYYQNLPNLDKLREDIEINILPWLVNIKDTVAALIKLIHDAAEIGEGQYRELAALQHDPADFIAQITLHAMRQKHIPPKPAELTKSQSGVLTDARRHRPPQPCPYFCGRERELAELFALLQSQHCVFVRGIDGIGKSEFVKKFAAEYQNAYDVRFFYYNNSLADTFSELGGTEDAIIDALHEISPNVLLIIDNFNPAELNDPLLFSFSDLPCRVLFTTPCLIEDVTAYELKEMSEDELLTLFRSFYSHIDQELHTVQKIIRAVHSYTFAVELAARILGKGPSSPAEVLHRLNQSSASTKIGEKVRTRRKNRSFYNTYHDHLSALFGLLNLSEVWQQYLKSCCYLPESGCHQMMFAAYLQISYQLVAELIDYGIVRRDAEKRLSIHPLLSDLIVEDLQPTVSDCMSLITTIAYYCRMTDEALDNAAELLSIGQRICGRITVDQPNVYIDFLFAMYFYLDKLHKHSGKEMFFRSLCAQQSAMTDTDLIHYRLAQANLAQCQERIEQTEIILLQDELTLDDSAPPEVAGLIYSELGQLYVRTNQLGKAEHSFKKAFPFYQRVLEHNRKTGVIPMDAVTFILAYSKLLFSSGNLSKQQKGEKILKQLIDNADKHPIEDIEIYADFAQRLLEHFLETHRPQEFNSYFNKVKLLFQRFYPNNPEQVSRLCGRCQFVLTKYMSDMLYQIK